MESYFGNDILVFDDGAWVRSYVHTARVYYAAEKSVLWHRKEFMTNRMAGSIPGHAVRLVTNIVESYILRSLFLCSTGIAIG